MPTVSLPFSVSRAASWSLHKILFSASGNLLMHSKLDWNLGWIVYNHNIIYLFSLHVRFLECLLSLLFCASFIIYLLWTSHNHQNKLIIISRQDIFPILLHSKYFNIETNWPYKIQVSALPWCQGSRICLLSLWQNAYI